MSAQGERAWRGCVCGQSGFVEVVRCGGAWGMVDGAVRERPVRGGPGERGVQEEGGSGGGELHGRTRVPDDDVLEQIRVRHSAVLAAPCDVRCLEVTPGGWK